MPPVNRDGRLSGGSAPLQSPLDPSANGDAPLCLGRTCLAWQADGELRPNDLRLILERLCLVDAQACQALLEAS
jgi:hypothetical protein